MSFGGGSGGEIKYKISVDATDATTKLPQVSQQIQQLGQATASTSQQMGALPQQYQTIVEEGNKVTKTTRDIQQTMQGTVTTVTTATTSQRNWGQALKDNVLSIGIAASSIIGLVTQYISLQRAQVNTERASIIEQRTKNRVIDLTNKLGIATRKYGADSQEVAKIQRDLNVAQQQAGIATQRHTLLQEQLNVRMAEFATQILPNLIGAGSGIAQVIIGIKQWSGATAINTVKTIESTGAQIANAGAIAGTGTAAAGSIAPLEGMAAAEVAVGNGAKVAAVGINKLKVATVIGAILVGIEVAAQAVANNFLGFRDRIEELYNWLVKIAPVFKPVIDAIWTIGQALTALFTGDIDALTKMFSKAPPVINDVTAASDGLTESGKELAKQAKEDTKAWDEYVQKMEEVDTASNKLWHTLEDKGTKALLGLKGLKGFKGLADDVTDVVKSFEGLGSKLLFAFKLPEYDKFFRIPKGTGKKLAQGVSHDLQDIKKALDPEFSKAIGELQDKIKKDGEKGGKKTAEIMAQFFINNPELYRQIKELDMLPPEVISIIESKMTQARAKVDLLIGDAFDPAKQLSTGKTGPLTTGYLQDLTKQALFGTDGGGGGGEDKKDGGFSAIIKTMTDSLKTLTDALPNTTKLFTTFVNSVSTAAVATWNAFSSAVSITADWLTELIAPQGWAVFVQGVDDAIVATWNAFSSSISIIADWLTELIAPQGWAVFIAGVDDAIVSTWNAFSSSITVIADWLTELIAPKGWDVFLKGVDDAIVSTWNAFSSSITVVANWISELIAPKGWGEFVKTVSADVNKVWDTWQGILGTISDWLFDLQLPAGWTAFIGSVSDAVASTWKALGGAFAAISAGLQPLITAGVGVINALTNLFKAKGSSTDIPTIPEKDKNKQGGTSTEGGVYTGQGQVYRSGLYYGGAVGSTTGNIAGAGADTLIRALQNSGISVPPALKTGNSTVDEIMGFVQDPYNWFRKHGGAKYQIQPISVGGGGKPIGMQFMETILSGGGMGAAILGLGGPSTGLTGETLKYQQAQLAKQKGVAGGTQIKGIGQLMGEQTDPFAKIAVGAQAVQKALANLAVQGGNSMRLLANNILKNTANLSGNFVTIAKQSQLGQKALANLAIQGGNSMRLLANAILKNTANLMGNFTTIAKISQVAQKALANLAIQGGNSFRILANLILKNTNNLLPNFTNIYIAAGHVQTGLANLANEGTKSMQVLAKASSKQMQGMIKNFNKGYESAGHLQEGLANLANEGSDSLQALAKASSKAMNGMINNFKKGESAAKDLKKAINAIPSGGGGGDWTSHIFQHGYHGWVSKATPFIAGEAGPEYVSVTPANQMGVTRSADRGQSGFGTGQLTVHLTNVLADREIIRTYRRKLGEDFYRFGPS